MGPQTFYGIRLHLLLWADSRATGGFTQPPKFRVIHGVNCNTVPCKVLHCGKITSLFRLRVVNKTTAAIYIQALIRRKCPTARSQYHLKVFTPENNLSKEISVVQCSSKLGASPVQYKAGRMQTLKRNAIMLFKVHTRNCKWSMHRFAYNTPFWAHSHNCEK